MNNNEYKKGRHMKAKEVRCIYCGGTHTDLIENDSFIWCKIDLSLSSITR